MNKYFSWIFVIFTAFTLSAYASDDAQTDQVETNEVEEVAAVETDDASTDEVAAADEVNEEASAE